MKSAELQNDDKNFSSSEDAGVKGRSDFETPEASKQNDEQPNHGCDLIQDTEATILKRNHSKEALTNDAEGTCKINWLKEVPVKASLHTGEGEANPIETAPKPATARGLDLNLKFSGHTENKQETVTPGEANPTETAPKPATARGLDLNLEYSGQAENKLETVTPVVEVGRSSPMPQDDMTAQKGNIISEGQHAENSHSKSSGKTQENTHKTAPFSNKKRPLVEDGTPGTSSQQNFQVWNSHILLRFIQFDLLFLYLIYFCRADIALETESLPSIYPVTARRIPYLEINYEFTCFWFNQHGKSLTSYSMDVPEFLFTGDGL